MPRHHAAHYAETSTTKYGPLAMRFLALAWVAANLIGQAGAAPVVAIDVGHSWERPGAMSARGRPEFEFNRALARAIHEHLAARRVASILIGEDGQMANLDARTTQAQVANASFFLSVHHDSVQPGYLQTWMWQGAELKHAEHTSGFSLFVSRKNPHARFSLECASKVGRV